MKMGKTIINNTAALFLTLLAVCCTEGRLFNVTDANTTCILLDVTFELNLTALTSSQLQVDSRSWTESDDIMVLGDCNTNTLNLTFPDNTSWVFQFHQGDDENVDLFNTITIIPKDVFNATEVPIEDEQILPAMSPISLGASNSSYSCDVAKVFHYKSASEGDFTFETSVVVAFLQAQAFNIENDDFSPAVNCSNQPTTTTTTTSAPTKVTTMHYTTTTLAGNSVVHSTFVLFSGLVMAATSLFV